MRVWIKQGVMGTLVPEMRKCLGRIQRVYQSNDIKDFFITSMQEGNHMLGSLHYDSRAVDFHAQTIAHDDVLHAAGQGFDVIKFTAADGIACYHVEFDPK